MSNLLALCFGINWVACVRCKFEPFLTPMVPDFCVIIYLLDWFVICVVVSLFLIFFNVSVDTNGMIVYSLNSS